MQGLPYVMNRRIGPKKQVGNRIATWNVGTMTGKSMEVAEALKRRKVDVACIQEVKWKGKKAREIGMGYKLFYSGESRSRNGVGIILKDTLCENILAVERISDRIMLLKLIDKSSKKS